jgi:hypothetical protein
MRNGSFGPLKFGWFLSERRLWVLETWDWPRVFNSIVRIEAEHIRHPRAVSKNWILLKSRELSKNWISLKEKCGKARQCSSEQAKENQRLLITDLDCRVGSLFKQWDQRQSSIGTGRMRRINRLSRSRCRGDIKRNRKGFDDKNESLLTKCCVQDPRFPILEDSRLREKPPAVRCQVRSFRLELCVILSDPIEEFESFVAFHENARKYPWGETDTVTIRMKGLLQLDSRKKIDLRWTDRFEGGCPDCASLSDHQWNVRDKPLKISILECCKVVLQ